MRYLPTPGEWSRAYEVTIGSGGVFFCAWTVTGHLEGGFLYAIFYLSLDRIAERLKVRS